MKLIMTLLVRDEQDIVPCNIEYHLSRGVDFIIATDNRSAQSTTNVLKSYQRQGVLHYIREPEDTYAQSRWVTRMVRLAVDRYQADWIINNDVDEFWWPDARAGNLKDVLAGQPSSVAALAVTRYNFVPRRETERAWWLDTMTIREKQSFNALGNPLPPKVCHRAMPGVTVAAGNHSVSHDGYELSAQPSTELMIFHFPMRTYKQFAAKIKKGGAAHDRNTELSPEIGATWRGYYEKYRTGRLRNEIQQAFIPDIECEHKLATGELLHDARLRDYCYRYLSTQDIKKRSRPRALERLADLLEFDGLASSSTWR